MINTNEEESLRKITGMAASAVLPIEKIKKLIASGGLLLDPKNDRTIWKEDISTDKADENI